MGKVIEFGVSMRPTAAMVAGTVANGKTQGERRPHVDGSLIDLRITIAEDPWPVGFVWAIIERWPDQMKETILIGGHEKSIIEASVKAQGQYERILKERGK